MIATLNGKLGYGLDLPDDHVVFDPRKRHDFVFLFDASRCNPNGDPDNDNMPRQDFETRQGLMTSGAQKRKLRDFMAEVYGTGRDNNLEGRMNLYVKQKGLLGAEHKTVAVKFGKGSLSENQKNMRAFFWDVRMFGGVLAVGKEDVGETEVMDGLIEGSTGPDETPAPRMEKKAEGKKSGGVRKESILNGGQCVGCVSINTAETVEEIAPGLMSIVRTARVSNPEITNRLSDAQREEIESANKDRTATSSMPGNQAGAPYGLYHSTGQYFARLDKDELVTGEDLAVLWNGLQQMFQFSVSDARPAGSMRALGAWVFSHDHPLGNFPLHKLHNLIKIVRADADDPSGLPARQYSDYRVDLAWDSDGGPWKADEARLTKDGKEIGVTLTELYNDWRE